MIEGIHSVIIIINSFLVYMKDYLFKDFSINFPNVSHTSLIVFYHTLQNIGTNDTHNMTIQDHISSNTV